jgi:hypothetical protein
MPEEVDTKSRGIVKLVNFAEGENRIPASFLSLSAEGSAALVAVCRRA